MLIFYNIIGSRAYNLVIQRGVQFGKKGRFVQTTFVSWNFSHDRNNDEVK